MVAVDVQIKVRWKFQGILEVIVMPNKNGFPGDGSAIMHSECNGGFVIAALKFVGRGVVVFFASICHVCFLFGFSRFSLEFAI